MCVFQDFSFLCILVKFMPSSFSRHLFRSRQSGAASHAGAATAPRPLQRWCRRDPCHLPRIPAKFHPATFFTFSRLKNPVPRTLNLTQNGPFRPPHDTTAPRPSHHSCRRHPRADSHPKCQNLTTWSTSKIRRILTLNQSIYISFLTTLFGLLVFND
jgi:hypothetical protein